MKMVIIASLAASVLLQLVSHTSGHGRMMEPPARNTLWRFGYPVPPNYDDDGLNCGGYYIQWTISNGTCGECGDPYNMTRPRTNEDGGKYGRGFIVRNYTMGQDINITIVLTTNHGGYFNFRICPNNNVRKPVDQSCLNKHVLQLANGSGTKFYIEQKPEQRGETFHFKIRLPQDLLCTQCVLQWHYKTANNWGICPNGTQGMGCGPQETFQNCADVGIYKLEI